jgi:hypothetical protein
MQFGRFENGQAGTPYLLVGEPSRLASPATWCLAIALSLRDKNRSPIEAQERPTRSGPGSEDHPLLTTKKSRLLCDFKCKNRFQMGSLRFHCK